MKFLGIAFFLIILLIKPKDYIIIEHIGQSSKDIRTIIISKEIFNNEKSLEYKNYIVDEKTYNILRNRLELKNSNQTCGGDFGTFSFKISSKSKDIKFCLSRKESMDIFKNIIDDLQDNNEDVKNVIKYNLQRISY